MRTIPEARGGHLRTIPFGFSNYAILLNNRGTADYLSNEPVWGGARPSGIQDVVDYNALH